MKHQHCLRCSFLRACGSALLEHPKHKSGYVHQPPHRRIPLTRESLGNGSPPSHRDYVRRPGSAAHNRALCYLTRLPVTVLAHGPG
jgi:hypothetical protein